MSVKASPRGHSPQSSSVVWKLTCRFSRDRPRFTDTMDVIKFLCKDLWTILFRKQIDNLKTNHRVCFILRIRFDGREFMF